MSSKKCQMRMRKIAGTFSKPFFLNNWCLFAKELVPLSSELKHIYRQIVNDQMQMFLLTNNLNDRLDLCILSHEKKKVLVMQVLHRSAPQHIYFS